MKLLFYSLISILFLINRVFSQYQITRDYGIARRNFWDSYAQSINYRKRVPFVLRTYSAKNSSTVCPAKEMYSECGSRCTESCNNINNSTDCPTNVCDKGCFCKVGFYRDKAGSCVPAVECNACTDPPQCPPNEKLKKCGCHCIEMCENRNNPEDCPAFKKEVGCFCIKGYFRNNEGVCVPEESCDATYVLVTTPAPPRMCPKGEFFSNCGSRCDESCENVDNQTACVGSAPHSCDIGCFCKEGLYRDVGGVCAEREMCPNLISSSPLSSVKSRGSKATPPPLPECPNHEVWNECGNRCAESIDNLNNPSVCYQNICDIGCFCIQDFYRDEYGLCIFHALPPSPPPAPALPPTPPSLPSLPPHPSPPEEPLSCPNHETYKECGNRCIESMNSIDNPNACPPNSCETGCFCVNGFFRDQYGLCIPPQNIAPVNPTIGGPPPLPIAEKPITCPIHESYKECGSLCIESMENFDNPNVCPKDSCNTGCFCIDGYYRDQYGLCILPPKLTPTLVSLPSLKRGQPSLPTEPLFPAQPLLPSVQISFPLFPSLPRLPTFPVLPPAPQVPPPPPPPPPPKALPSCPEHEAYSECGNRCLESIKNIDNPSACLINSCDIGCFCIHGFHRNEFELCALPQQKSISTTPPPIYCPPSERYVSCGSRCLESCNNINNSSLCQLNGCDVGCFCQPGLLRDDKGICVSQCEGQSPITDAPICPDSEQNSLCGNRCLESCVNANNPSVCPLNKCDTGCFCKPGLFRDEGGICVPIKLCGMPEPINTCPISPQKCLSDQEYSECKSRCLELCVNKDNPSVCPTDRCDVGCFCESGLFRDDEGFCVPAERCEVVTTTATPICPESEEDSLCGSHCLESCVNANDPSVCPLNSCDTGCFCKSGLFRGEGGICVPIELCEMPEQINSITTNENTCPTKSTLECLPDQEYSECKSRCLELCVNKDNPSVCPTDRCDVGCFCESGLFRNDEGFCVPADRCV